MFSFLFGGDHMGALEFHMQGNHLPVGRGDGIQLFGQFLFQARIPGDAQQRGAGTGQAKGRAGGADQAFTNPYFITGAGGTLQSIIFGFAGMEITDKGIKQMPFDRILYFCAIKGIE